MRRACMIVHQVKEPTVLNIRLLTEFDDLTVNGTNLDQRIAHFFLYTKDAVYEGELKKIDINIQLTWNEKCISALTDSLNGKRTNIDIKFIEQPDDLKPTEMSLICQIQTGINIRLFQIAMFKIPEMTPMKHMKKLFIDYKDSYSEQEMKFKQQKERIQHQVKEMVALEKQIEEQTVTQIAHLKRNFIDVINACKKQLKKHMKTGITEIINEEEEIAEEEVIANRRIVRVNRQTLENQIPSRRQDPPIQNEFMDMLFDS